MKTVLICAMSLDGRIARTGDDRLDWTTPADMRFFVRETKRIGVVIMGHATYRTIGRPLPGRLNVVMTRSVAGKQSIPNQLEYTSLQPAELLESLGRRGYNEIAVVGGGDTNSAFLRASVVDEVWVSIIPKLLGNGIGLAGNESLSIDLEYLSQEMLSEQVMLIRYRVKR